MTKIRALAAAALVILTSACAANLPNPKDYTAFQKAAPRSVLIVPVINHSNETQAADLFLTTLAVPLAERGYYVFPTNMAKKLIESEGMSDPGLVHGAPTPAIAGMFGADTVLYVEILDWKSKYVVLATNIDVKFLYTLKDGHTGAVLWQDEQAYTYSKSARSGNILVNLVANAITAMADNGRADYTPVAVQANVLALMPDGQGIPYGPYSSLASHDVTAFPATGSGRVSNATTQAVSVPVIK
jgi:hypothetical protein